MKMGGHKNILFFTTRQLDGKEQDIIIELFFLKCKAHRNADCGRFEIGPFNEV